MHVVASKTALGKERKKERKKKGAGRRRQNEGGYVCS